MWPRPLDPATIDCNAAATNVAALCSAQCDDVECSGMEQNTDAIIVSCEATKTLSCINMMYGCYAESDECQVVKDCFDDFL